MEKLLYTFVFFTLIFTSCSKNPNRVLPQKDGKWKFVAVSNITVDGVLESTNTEIGTMIFGKSKSFTRESNGNVDIGTWSATRKTVTIHFGSSSFEYQVEEKSSKFEKWEFSRSVTLNGQEILTTQIIDLEKT